MSEHLFNFNSSIGILFHEFIRGEHLVSLEESINGNYRDLSSILFVRHLINATCFRLDCCNNRVAVDASKLIQDEIDEFSELFVHNYKDSYSDDTPRTNESNIDFVHRCFSEEQEFIKRTFERAYSRIKSTWNTAAEFCWYPCPEMSVKIKGLTLCSPSDLDNLMIERVENYLDKTLDNIVSNFSSRKHIITNAFRLHKSENYIASIPLLLAQAEGIFEFSFKKRFYSRNGGRVKKIKKIIQQDSGDAFNAFLSASLVESEFMKSEKNPTIDTKKRGPNRNGILHGDERHLDYGTHVNSCKAITLLAYVSWMSETIEGRKQI